MVPTNECFSEATRRARRHAGIVECILLGVLFIFHVLGEGDGYAIILGVAYAVHDRHVFCSGAISAWKHNDLQARSLFVCR